MPLTNNLFLLGRIIFGLYFLMRAGNHLLNTEQMTGYAQSKGVPSARWAVIATGILLLIGALSIGSGFQPTVGIAALAIYLILETLAMHQFWKVENPQERAVEVTNFTKNLALLGAVLMLLAIRQPWPLSFTLGT